MRLRQAFFAVIPALFLSSSSSSAQTVPPRPIIAIIPFAAGNASDITARVKAIASPDVREWLAKAAGIEKE